MHGQARPQLEYMSGSAVPPAPPPKKSRRLGVFLLTLVICLAIGLSFNFLRDPVYRTGATVLTVAPKGIDERSAAADLEHVSIQRSLLLSDEVVDAVRVALDTNPLVGTLPPDLRQVLRVDAVKDTNLVELAAEGDEPLFLQTAVNTWVDAYVDLRAARVAAATGRTTAALEDEQEKLHERIQLQRIALADFRGRHAILSQERSENSALAELKAIRQSLQAAEQRSVDAQARLEAVKAAIARGDPVVPKEDRSELSSMMTRAATMRARLASLDKRFTRAYLDTDPKLRELPDQLAAIEFRINEMVKEGKRVVLSEARQDLGEAQAAETELRQRLQQREATMSEFSARFAEYQTMERELDGLEKLLAANQERLAQIEITNRERFPPLEVVDRAPLPLEPIRPDYWRDAGWISVGSVLIALFVAWLADYLTAAPKSAPVTDIHIHGVNLSPQSGPSLDAPETAAAPTLTAAQRPQLAQILPPELDIGVLSSALASADRGTAAALGLLLSGVQPAELEQVDPAMQGALLAVNGRTIELPARACELLNAAGAAGVEVSGQACASGLIVIAADLGLADPATLSPEAVQHTYILHLVRQGARLSELAQRIGQIPVDRLSQYAAFSPAGQNLPINEIELEHPALAT